MLLNRDRNIRLKLRPKIQTKYSSLFYYAFVTIIQKQSTAVSIGSAGDFTGTFFPDFLGMNKIFQTRQSSQVFSAFIVNKPSFQPFASHTSSRGTIQQSQHQFDPAHSRTTAGTRRSSRMPKVTVLHKMSARSNVLNILSGNIPYDVQRRSSRLLASKATQLLGNGTISESKIPESSTGNVISMNTSKRANTELADGSVSNPNMSEKTGTQIIPIDDSKSISKAKAKAEKKATKNVERSNSKKNKRVDTETDKKSTEASTIITPEKTLHTDIAVEDSIKTIKPKPIKRSSSKKNKRVITETEKKSTEASTIITPEKKLPPDITVEDSVKSTKRKRTKRKSIEPGSLVPPKEWENIYSLVVELRNDKSAPVDHDGAEMLASKGSGGVVYRFQTMVALMLSSQTKDAVVGETIRALQKHGLDVENIRKTPDDVLNQLIFKCGFRNNKTKFIKEAAERICSEYGGDIPQTAEELMKLNGIGPKMAYIIESICLGRTTGIGVDTHMHRIFNELGWVKSKTPEQTRVQLEGWLPKEKWGEVNYLWVGMGQEVQQQKGKVLDKALSCSRPSEAVRLLTRLNVDCQKEALKHGLTDKYRRVVDKK